MEFLLLFVSLLPFFEIKDTIYSYAYVDNLLSNFRAPYNYSIKSLAFYSTPIYSNLLVFKGYNIYSPSLGGTLPEENLVFFDGIPLINPMLGYQELSLIPANIIGIVEVIHSSSPISGLAGIGGAINLIPLKNPLELKVSNLRKELKLGIGPFKGLSFTVFHETFTDSFPIEYENITLWVKNTHDKKTGFLAKFSQGTVLVIKRKAGAPGPLGSLSTGERDELSAGSNFNFSLKKCNLQLSSNYTSQTYTSSGTSDFHKTLFLRGVIKGKEVETGANLYGANSTKIGNHIIPEIFGILGIKRMLTQKTELIATINLIYNPTFKTLFPNPSISLSNNLKFDLFSFLTVSLNHRNPTLNELYWPEDNFARGNPELKPERSFNIDAGLRKVSPKSYLNLFVFFKKINNGILWVQEDKYVPKNFVSLSHKGAGLEAVFKPRNDLIYAEFSLNLQDSRLNGMPFIYRPNLTLSSSLGMGPTKIELSYIGKRPERPNSAKMLPPVWMINLSMEKSFTLVGQNLAVRAGVENLLNKNHEIVRGYPLPGRELFFEISVNRRM